MRDDVYQQLVVIQCDRLDIAHCDFFVYIVPARSTLPCLLTYLYCLQLCSQSLPVLIFRVQSLAQCLHLLTTFAGYYCDLSSYKEIFASVRHYAMLLPLSKYPDAIKVLGASRYSLFSVNVFLHNTDGDYDNYVEIYISNTVMTLDSQKCLFVNFSVFFKNGLIRSGIVDLQCFVIGYDIWLKEIISSSTVYCYFWAVMRMRL